MSSEEKSLVVYESRAVWMNNLLKRLGLIQIENDEQTEEEIEDEDDNSQECDLFDDDVTCDSYLKTLDPREWKNQDHYKVLALSRKRINATESEIKKSYRKIVLRHHPDKQGQNVDLKCHYFSCITKAYEILGDPQKRRSYDSIDPTFDNTIPNPTTYNKNRFYEVFGPVIERNAIWSVNKPVPLLGSEKSTIEEVDCFYKFWYNFESWREYSYLDEEEKEKGENREERRYLDKQNKIARNQRKKEEMQRIRQLVDNTYECDPRVALYKENLKKQKEETKLAKQIRIKAQKEEEARLKREREEQELAAKKKAEEEERERREREKKQKEALKKKTKKEQKILAAILESHDYFADNDPNQKIEHMKEFDKFCKFYSIEQIISMRQIIESLPNVDEKKKHFLQEVDKMNQQLEDERTKLANSATNATSNQNGNNSTSSKKNWSYEDVQLIIKAVKLFPAGTPNRWAVIANYINDKSDSGVVRNHRDVLEKAKELQHSNESQGLKEEANKNAFKKLEIQATQNSLIAKKKDKESNPSERYDAPNTILEVNDSPWTNEEQQLLEQAMKTYPTSLGTERWTLIAECIPNRSRADCIKRYKHLVEMVKAKNAAKNKTKS